MNEDTTTGCPFSIGDIVKFNPCERTRGWYQNIELFGVKIGQELEIVRIKENVYLYFENDAGGWPWNEFELVKRKSNINK